MECVIILRHVVVLLITAVPLHFVAAREPALQPLGAGPLDFHGNILRGGESTPVEDIEPLCSFTVTERSSQCNRTAGSMYVWMLLLCIFLLIICILTGKAGLWCSLPEGSNSWAQVVRAPWGRLIQFWELVLRNAEEKNTWVGTD